MKIPSKTLQSSVLLLAITLCACGSSSGGGGGAGGGAATGGAGGGKAATGGAGGGSAAAGGAGGGGGVSGLGGAAGGKGAAGAGGSAGNAGAGGAASGGAAGSAAGGAVGTAACNALTSTGWNPAGVHKMAAAGTPPTAAGQPIADGRYILTREDVYPPDAADTVPVGATIVISGNQEQYFMDYESTGIAVYINYSLSAAGTTLTSTVTCASSNYNGLSPATVGSVSTLSYTATATTLLLFNGNLVQTFTKQ
jgi:hypothetical protein